MLTSNKMPELWKGEELKRIDIEGNYLVTNYGRVWSARTGKWLGKGEVGDLKRKVTLTTYYNGHKFQDKYTIGELVIGQFGRSFANEYYIKELWRKHNEVY